MPCFISTDSRRVDMSARGRHADEAFISDTTNEPFATTASAPAASRRTPGHAGRTARETQAHNLWNGRHKCFFFRLDFVNFIWK